MASIDPLVAALDGLGVRRGVLVVGTRLADAVRLRRDANRTRSEADARARIAATQTSTEGVSSGAVGAPEGDRGAGRAAEPARGVRRADGRARRDRRSPVRGADRDAGGARRGGQDPPRPAVRAPDAAALARRGRGSAICPRPRTATAIAVAVAAALGVLLTDDDPIAQVGAALDGRPAALLVLDNFEQVAPFAAATLGAWADRAPHCRFVATSRQRLALPDEGPPCPSIPCRRTMRSRCS